MTNFTYKLPRKPITCKDGFKISVQAGQTMYSDPKNDEGSYTRVECGFPSEAEILLIPFAESCESLTKSVYPYVPSEVIDKVIRLHGGVASGELPELIV